MPKLQFFVAALLISVCLFSCGVSKKVVYFSDTAPNDTAVRYQTIAPEADAVIQPDDILAINVSSPSFAPDDRPSQVFLDGGLSFGNASDNGVGGAVNKNSYLVDSAGYIDYPRIGKLKMGGLTIRQAKEAMVAQLKDYIKQPVIEVRIVNYKITLLGEVSRPGPLLTSNHKMTIIDAIAAAGGIPITGRIDNVLVIREVNGRREEARLNLHSNNVFNSPYFRLKQNDIVYVEQSKVKKEEANTFLRLYLPVFTSLLTSAVTIVALVRLNNR
ncbi:MAG: polysaccharide biosynthesis/export family protein [Bacteroidetes bacterium]|nr:polysaccharide biosynthesis/export family protein [Bacteroidota bacterium]